MSKKKKTVLLIVGLVLLAGICCVCVGAYAKSIINQPKFVVPEAELQASATEIPADDEGKLAYISKLYDGSFTDEAEADHSYDISIDTGSVKSNASGSDLACLMLAKDRVVDFVKNSRQVSGDYRCKFAYVPENIGEFTFTRGTTNDAGEITDEDYYFFEIKGDGVSDGDEDFTPFITDAVNALAKELDGTAEIKNYTVTKIHTDSKGKIDRIRDHLLRMEIRRFYTAEFTLSFVNEYEALGEINLSFDFSAADIYDYKWYGAYFTEKALYLNPGDSETLPLSTYVAEGTAAGDFKLKFDLSAEGVIFVDENGNLEALEAADEPVEITMTFEYKGRTYTDNCFVTVTDLEVETNG